MAGERMSLFRIYMAAIALLGIALACEPPTPLPSSRGQETTNKQDTTQNEEASRDEDETQKGGDCILQAGVDFSWGTSEPAVQQGSYARACSYDFTIHNTSNEDQKVILYELWDNTGETGGMTWEKWNVRLLAAGDSYTYGFSYSTWDNGTDTWYYADKLLVIRDTPECFALSVAANEANLLLWEQHATHLENICK